VSYYLKGSLIALCLDLTIRSRTRGRKSLDDILRALWHEYGKTGLGVPEDGIERLAERVTGIRLRTFFDRALRSTEELPLRRLLASVGIDMRLRPAESATDKGGKPAIAPARELASRVTLGVRVADDANGARLSHVLDGGAAQAAGLSAGDVLVAIDGFKVSAGNLDRRLARHRPGDVALVHAFRSDQLLEFRIAMRAAPLDTCTLALTGSDRAAANRRRAWLHLQG